MEKQSQQKVHELFLLQNRQTVSILWPFERGYDRIHAVRATGGVFFTVADWGLQQRITQQNEGGLTDAYLSLGTYVKSFYSVMFCPSCVKISALGDGSKGVRHERIHHRVDWTHCTPMIISEKWKK